MAGRLLSVLVGVFADRFRATADDATEPPHEEPAHTGPAQTGAVWSPHLGHVPGWSTPSTPSGHPGHANHVPTSSPVISQRFGTTRDQVRPARNFVAEILGDDHPLCDDAVLLTSELATNAVEHPTQPVDTGTADTAWDGTGPGERPGEFVVTVAFVPHGVIVTVQDPGSARIPCVRNSGPDATGGRGLMLVNDLATRWGFHRDGTGTVIWFELGSPG